MLQELSYVIDLLGRKAQYPTFLSEIFQYILRRKERQVLSRKILGRYELKYSQVLFEKNSTSGGYKGSVSDKIYDKWLILDKYKYLFTNTHMICIYVYTYKIQDISRCFEKISTNGGVTRAQYENMFAKYLGSQVWFLTYSFGISKFGYFNILVFRYFWTSHILKTLNSDQEVRPVTPNYAPIRQRCRQMYFP